MTPIPPGTTVVFQAGRIEKELKIGAKGRMNCQQALLGPILSYWLVLTHLATAGRCGL